MRPTAPALPWYRHRGPWLLMAGPAAVVAAGIVTAWIAVTTQDGLVADDYYKQGLAVNMMLARQEAAAAQRLEARLRLSPERVELRLKSGAGAGLPTRVRLTLTHPTRKGEDRQLLLAGADGVYGGALDPLGPGRWRAVIEDEAASWRLAGSVQLPDAPEALIDAAMQSLIRILWPSFIMAGIGEVVFFTLVDPQELYLLGRPVRFSPLATYTIGFFAFWALTAASSAFTCFIQRGEREINRCG